MSLELPEGGHVLPGSVPKANAGCFFKDGSISRAATSQARKWGGGGEIFPSKCLFNKHSEKLPVSVETVHGKLQH